MDANVPANSELDITTYTTGEKLVHLDLGQHTTQRVNRESKDSVVLDVWADGRMALLRCDLAKDGGCEPATKPAKHQDPVPNPPMPYLLPEPGLSSAER